MTAERYPIRLYGDPVLRRRAAPIRDIAATFTVPRFNAVDLPRLARNMLETMYEAHGVGLAAPQIGLPLRMFVAAEYRDDEKEGVQSSLKSRVVREFVVVNPTLEILDSQQEARYEDGCLSIPGVYEAGVMRERALRVRYGDEYGSPHVIEADAYLARVLQHEYEHLDGKLYLDRLPSSVKHNHRTYLASLQREAKAYLKTLPG